MSYAPVVRRDPFGAPACWPDAPDVQFVGQGTLNEVDECRVGRPQRKVTVKSGWSSEDGPTLRPPAAVCYEQRVSGSGSVVRESGGVAGPVVLGHAFEVRLRRSSQRWHRPDADVAPARAVRLANPKRNESAIGREPQGADRWIDEFRCAPTSQIVKLSRTNLRNPNIHRSVPVR